MDLVIGHVVGHAAHFRFDGNAQVPHEIHQALNLSDVSLQGQMGAVIHDGCDAQAHRLHDVLHVQAVVHVHGNGHTGFLGIVHHQGDGDFRWNVLILVLGMVDGDGNVHFFCCGDDGPKGNLVGRVDGRDGVVVLLRILQHFC